MCIIKTGDNGTIMHLQSESDEWQDMKQHGGVCPSNILCKTEFWTTIFAQNYKFVWVGTWGKKDFPLFFVIDYEFSIIDYHNNR